MELVNRETNFNKMFNATPNIGVLNPLAYTNNKVIYNTWHNLFLLSLKFAFLFKETVKSINSIKQW